MWQSDASFHRLVVVPPKMVKVCKECGCRCHSCVDSNSLDFHHQIEELTSKLQASTNQIVQMEKDFTDSHLFSDQEMTKLQEELVKLRDRYDRLYDSHKKLSKVNQGLEDKLLNVVNKYECEKANLESEITNLHSRMMDSRMAIADLEEENERYRTDCNVAVQLLQCRPSNFVAHKLHTLPLDLQQRLLPHLTKEQMTELEQKREEPKLIRVPMPTFPPTAMVYSNKYDTVHIEPKSGGKSVPMTLIAKVLTQPQTVQRSRRTYICAKCKCDVIVVEKGVQTTGYDVDNTSSRRSSDGDSVHNGTSGAGSNVHKPSRTKLTTETEI